MKENLNFYRCPICGNIVKLIDGNMDRIICCGKSMIKMIANTTDAVVEKHVPVYERVDNEIVVKVGEVEHPMEEEHYIMWIAQVSKDKVVRVKLHPESKIEVRFPYISDSVLYAYCNKHGLWKKIVE
ncbi:MAG: desulfoferrodoxin family protein [Bacilli bacterium]